MKSFCAGIGCTAGAFCHYKLFYMIQRALFEDVETSIAKRPSEYGKGYIEERYRTFRNQFFEGDAGNLPAMISIGFSKRVRALGHCSCRVQIFFGVPEVLKCEIVLSDAYDFTPKKLDEVLIHEMIHAYLDYSDDIRDVKETHGPRFQEWCDRINARSDYRITVVSDTPITLNNGMVNRISNDGTVLLVARDYKPGQTAISRVAEKDLSWAIPKAAKWLNRPIVPYACSDANFKGQFVTGRSTLHGKIFPNATVDEMIESGIMREIQPPKPEAPQTALLLAWPWRNGVGYSLVVPRLEYEAANRIEDMLRRNNVNEPISKYHLNSYFGAWDGSPVNSSRKIRYRVMDKERFNDIVKSGDITYIEDV